MDPVNRFEHEMEFSLLKRLLFSIGETFAWHRPLIFSILAHVFRDHWL